MKHQLSKKRIYRNTSNACWSLARWSMEILVFTNECVSHVYVMLRHAWKMMKVTLTSLVN